MSNVIPSRILPKIAMDGESSDKMQDASLEEAIANQNSSLEAAGREHVLSVLREIKDTMVPQRSSPPGPDPNTLQRRLSYGKSVAHFIHGPG